MQEYKAQDGTIIDLENWVWVVTYKDGSSHYQFDSTTGVYNNFASINLDEVSRITMLCPKNGKQYAVDLPEGSKLIHYYDNIMQQPLGGVTVHHRLYCFGYEILDTESDHIREKKLFTILPTDVVIHGEIENMEIL